MEELLLKSIQKIKKLEAELFSVKLENSKLRKQNNTLKDRKNMYKENCIFWKKSNDELQDSIATMLVDIGTPINEEIKKYQAIQEM